MRAIRVSDQDGERLTQLQKLLHQNGMKELEGLQEICPKCGAMVDGFRFETAQLHCPSCGHQENGAALTGFGAFALGTIVGLGIAALASYLSSRRQENANRL